MLADEVRNRACTEAIAAKVRPGNIVLDIGCGAGLTAMLAAVPVPSTSTPVSSSLIAQNGLSDRITIISKMSHDLVVGEDLPEQ